MTLHRDGSVAGAVDRPDDIRELRPGDVDFGPVGRTVGFLTRLAQVAIVERFYGAFDATGLSPAKLSLLACVMLNPKARQGVLAEALRIKRANMVKLVRGLEEAGLLERTIPDDDRRSVVLSVTPRGREIAEQFIAAIGAFDRRTIACLTDGEYAELVRLLTKVTGNDTAYPPQQIP